MNNAKVFNDEAASVFERAISGQMKSNMLIYFAYGDFEEVSRWATKNFTTQKWCVVWSEWFDA